MAGIRKPRGASRDRHGRGMRRPLWSPRFEPGIAREGNFEATVEDCAAYLRDAFPEVFADLQVVVRDLPPLLGEITSIRRYAYRREINTVYLYRVPIQRFRAEADPIAEIFRIESYVIEAAAEMMGRDPRDFLENLD